MARKKTYRQELNDRQRKLKKAIKEGRELLNEKPCLSDEWFEKNKQLNSLRIDLKTTESRLEHYSKRNIKIK